MLNRVLCVAVLAVSALGVPPGAPAHDGVDGVDGVAHAAASSSRSCEGSLAGEEAAGVWRRAWSAPATGVLDVHLQGGAEGDWDLAAFDATAGGGGRALAASTASGSDERLTLPVRRGSRVVVQACRRSGGPADVPVALRFFAAPAGGERVRISLEAVAVSGPGDVARLERLGFDVTHDVTRGRAVVVAASAAERDLIDSHGRVRHTLSPDLALADRSARLAEARAATSSLPTGRSTYRRYEDYTTEMKQLAESHPGLVRGVVLGTSLEGRPIQGVEIATGVAREDDGRPVYVNMGVHHAREWPAGELPMEFAHDLVAGYGSDPRVSRLLEQVRVVIVPVVNPDGFVAARTPGPTPVDDVPEATAALSELDQAPYRRKNCRPTLLGLALPPCLLRPTGGVDLNRNYGAYWGGTGSSGVPSDQTYRGPSPFSEPESEAVHRFTSGLHVTVLITNHNFTEDGKWLRQPGFDDVLSVTPDEEAMKRLGDAMAAATGWSSERAYDTLGDVTGATEDWNYFSQGTYGFTAEIRGRNFHGAYDEAVVAPYRTRAGTAGSPPGSGVREAYLLAGEWAADRAHHGVVEGDAPSGALLVLRKAFSTATSRAGLAVDELLETRLRVPPSGRYVWDVNPSARPLFPGEVWTMSCALDGTTGGATEVAVARGGRVEVDWSEGCRPAS